MGYSEVAHSRHKSCRKHAFPYDVGQAFGQPEVVARSRRCSVWQPYLAANSRGSPFALAPSPLVLADARSAAVLAPAHEALVLADARPAAVLACLYSSAPSLSQYNNGFELLDLIRLTKWRKCKTQSSRHWRRQPSQTMHGVSSWQIPRPRNRACSSCKQLPTSVMQVALLQSARTERASCIVRSSSSAHVPLLL